jgi:hypothetical protein
MSFQSQFQHQPLGAHEIRLLALRTTIEGVSCTLNHYSLTSAPTFYALSYVWGTEPVSEHIELDQNPFPVTKHLLTGLLVLERQYGRKPFWIDAICIDQSNDAEKAVQVPQMASVFSSAEKVVAWLGPASDNSDLFMARVSGLNTIFAGITNLKSVSRRSWCDHGLPPLEDPLWLAFLKLSFRPWFTRLWVVQEVALARSAGFLCGEYEVELDEMMTFAKHLGGIDFPIRNDMVYTHNIQVPNTDHALACLPALQAFRQALRNGQNIPLDALLIFARAKHATEPVDKIYGMLGLMSKGVRDKIVVDYSPDAEYGRDPTPKLEGGRTRCN